MKYLFLVRNIRLVKVCGLWKQDPSSNWHCKIPKWFTEACIKNILVKLIFKTFTLENSKKKGLHIQPYNNRGGLFFDQIKSFRLLFR
jgi:hypothetical protein